MPNEIQNPNDKERQSPSPESSPVEGEDYVGQEIATSFY